jgi:hypothetical protein
MARLTFPDQQQDLQNAAGHSLAGECDWGVKVFNTRQMPRIGIRAFSFICALADADAPTDNRCRSTFHSHNHTVS